MPPFGGKLLGQVRNVVLRRSLCTPYLRYVHCGTRGSGRWGLPTEAQEETSGIKECTTWGREPDSSSPCRKAYSPARVKYHPLIFPTVRYKRDDIMGSESGLGTECMTRFLFRRFRVGVPRSEYYGVLVLVPK